MGFLASASRTVGVMRDQRDPTAVRQCPWAQCVPGQGRVSPAMALSLGTGTVTQEIKVALGGSGNTLPELKCSPGDLDCITSLS